MAIPALAIPCVGQKGAQGQVENQCPFSLALLRVALSRCFGWDERYLLYDIKDPGKFEKNNLENDKSV